MAKAEQGNAPHSVQELPKGEVIFSRQLTLRELLRIKPGEEGETKDLLRVAHFPFEVEPGHFKSLMIISFSGTQEIESEGEDEAKGPINDVPFNFEVRDLRDSFLHIVSFSETQPVSLGKLFPLLQAAKPGGVSRQGQDLDGILADWRIILPEVREREANSRELYDFHEKYVPEFSEFEANHFELFWKALESENRRRVEVSFFGHQLNQFIDEREFFAKYGRQHDLYNNSMIASFVLFALTKPFNSFLGEKGFNIPPNSNPRDLDSFFETRKLFNSMSEQERRVLAIEFYKKSVDKGGIEVERKFGRYFRWHEAIGSPWMTALIGENGELNRIEYTGVLKPLEIAIKEKGWHEQPDSFIKHDNGQIEFRKGESFMRMSIVQGEDGYKKVKLEDHHLPTVEPIVPLIVWQKDKQTGKRSYCRGKFSSFPKDDTLLGQLVVAAYSPKVRDQMPPAITMKGVDGEDKTQPMLEAQTVLLVPKFANQFLTQSPVILGLEALANTVNLV